MSIQDGTHTVNTRFKYQGLMQTDELIRQSNAELAAESSPTNEVVRCLNIIVANALDSESCRINANKFFVRNTRLDLSQSLELIRGYSFTVHAGMGNLLLNFNVATSAFLRPLLVSEFFEDTRTFDTLQRREDSLIGKRVFIEPIRGNKGDKDYDRLNQISSRIKTIVGFGPNIETISFRKKIKGADGKFLKNANNTFQVEPNTTSVTAHLMTVLNKSVITKRKAVNVGTRSDPIWYAEEHLRILPYQVYARPLPPNLAGKMVQNAAYAPAAARQLIENEGLNCLGLRPGTNSMQIRNCEVFSVVPAMLQVPSDLLAFPETKCKHRNGQMQRNTSKAFWEVTWDTRFWRTSTESLRYFILSYGVTTGDKKIMEDSFKERLGVCNITNYQIRKEGEETGGSADPFEPFVQQALNKAKQAGANLILLILHHADVPKYTISKNLADRTYGIQSLCFTTNDARGSKRQPNRLKDYMKNVMLKVNIKRGGINQKVDKINLTDTMILGADVVHPGPGSVQYCPSVAAIVGSVDVEGSTYLGSMRIQQKQRPDSAEGKGSGKEDKTIREIIDDVHGMVLERLMDYYEKRKSLPQHIIYYRDGVSEGQYEAVKTKEVDAIRAAFAEARKLLKLESAPTQAKIVAVVGVKRHHTRFYPQAKDRDERNNGNCKSGTFVDKAVTSPYYRDFYLQSHSGIKGTARPTHYFVVTDDGGQWSSLEKLRDLTHQLCYGYQRACVPVSYATPTYYADRLCERGRIYLRRFFVADLGLVNELRVIREDKVSALRAHPFGGTEQERKRQERIAVETEVRDQTLRLATQEFAANPKDEPGWANPWPKKIGEVMFWL